MKTTITTVLLGVFLALHAGAAFGSANYNSSRSNVYKTAGNAATASISLSGPSDTQTVYTTPATGSFYLQQFCASDVAGGVRLDVSGLGSVALAGTTASCVSFPSFLYLAPNAVVSCSTSSAAPAGSYFCSIGGLASPK